MSPMEFWNATNCPVVVNDEVPGARIFVASQFIVNRFPAEKNDQTLCTLRQKETCDCVVVLDVVRGATLGGITWKVALRCSHHESP